MISTAKLEANRRNAKKSTGPRTEEGKRRSSLNAMKHGLTARIPILPDEDPREFNDRMSYWMQYLKPQHGLEMIQVSRAAYCSWQLGRVERAQAARLCARALNEEDDRRRREEVEVTELALRLLSSTGAMHSADQVMRDRPDDGGTSGAGQTAFDTENHPALIVGRLESSKTGCMWLVEQWTDLASMLENDGAWLAPAQFRALRLQGTFPGDPLAPMGLGALLRACRVLDPNAAGLAGVISPVQHQDVPERSEEARLAEEARARQELCDLVKNETERIEARLAEHEERAELEGLLASHFSAWDESPQGERLRRYELTFHRCMFQIIDQFNRRKRHQSTGDRFNVAPSYGRMNCSQFEQYLPRVAEVGATAIAEGTVPGERSGIDDEKVKASVVVSPMPRSEPVAEQESTGRNEPTGGLGGASGQNVSRVEVALREASAFADEGGRLVRNEATAFGLAGAIRGNDVAKLEGGSRRERRARRARERANGKGGR
jgi:hypothetical protein